MKVVACLIVCLALAVVAVYASSEELQIGVTFRPETCERKSKSGDKLHMHYTGWLNDGSGGKGAKFDSSLDRGQPFVFTLGKGQVIAGWDQGLLGACVGEKRRLKIPAHLGYGDRGAGQVIPPKASLIFETEVLKIE